MTNKDIRWPQRFSNYDKALKKLAQAIALAKQRQLSDLENQGLIQAFEYTHELAWNTLKDFLVERGNNEIYGSRDATREAFKLGIIVDGEIWMNMIKSRNQTSHTYNEEVAGQITEMVIKSYFNEFITLHSTLSKMIA
ncbi:MAG: nucleotidyltransferase substrate binding, family protein [Burkholderiales bacterium]|jgi:nucleotidyltransferase substrate binding protein (TIGR01987 family)|nr:nucleotidyltransferase substrate binding, family protein [Burkholderiales bacterium]